MTSVPARLALFVLLLAVVFGGAAVAGGAIDPDGAAEDAPSPHAMESSEGGHQEETAAALPGLAVAQDGYRLELDRRSGRDEIAFRIVDEHGEPVRTFDVEHAKRMHLIVVRRDLAHFRHLHPTMASDGTWSVGGVDLPQGGSYRVYADFTIDGEQRTLGTDLQVPGSYAPLALPGPSSATADDQGLTVRRRAADGSVAFDVLRNGEVVNDELQDYLGAKGHLVTLRVGDLAYLHTHPDGDRLSFGVDLPTPGAYRSWVQFQLDGVVHTAAFTEEVTP